MAPPGSPKSVTHPAILNYNLLYTHYYNSNLIWRTVTTVSCRVDEAIPSDHPEMRSVEGDSMVWPHPRDVILYARSSYFYNNMFIIYLFLTLFGFNKLFWSLIQKNCGNVCHYVLSRHIHVKLLRYIIMFSVSGSMLDIYFMYRRCKSRLPTLASF